MAEKEEKTNTDLAPILNPALTIEQTLATVWDNQPCVYQADVSGGRKQIVYLPPTYVSQIELDHRNKLREQFAAENTEAKKQAKAQQEAEIKHLNLKDDEVKDYRARYSFWEVEEPAPLTVLFDSRIDTKTGTVNAPLLPAGLRRQ